MRKSEELSNPASCMSRAYDDEMTFVLLGRDAAGAATIRFWAGERIRLGKNSPDDPQIVEAVMAAASFCDVHGELPEEPATFCIICGLPIPERRVRQRSNTCSKEHANLLRAMYRKQADRRRCRSCAKPSTPEQRASYRAWLKDHPEFRPGGPSGKRGWPKGQKRTKAGTLHPVTPEAGEEENYAKEQRPEI